MFSWSLVAFQKRIFCQGAMFFLCQEVNILLGDKNSQGVGPEKGRC